MLGKNSHNADEKRPDERAETFNKRGELSDSSPALHPDWDFA
jgi:hypothetical protein